MRTRSDSPNKNCTREGCSKPLRARGLCGTHYNQTQPNRHKKITVACSCCGSEMVRDSSCTRWENTYCGEICRTYHRFGIGWSVDLPATHWARMYGATRQWPRHRATLVQAKAYECAWCGVGAESAQAQAKYCTRRCKQQYSKANRRGRERGATGTYTWMDIARLWVLFDRACAYCAVPTALTDIQAEHVVPLSRGGANNLTNLLPSCAACNSDKRDLMLHEWNADRTRRHLALVTTEWDSADPRYKHLTSVRGSTAAA